MQSTSSRSKSGCIFLGEGLGIVLGMEGTFGIQKDDRPEKVTNQRERAMRETNMGQRKEEKGRKEHKGKERGKGGQPLMNIAEISDIRTRAAH